MIEKQDIFDGVSLQDAKSWLRERVEKGARCPCCTQYAKVYTRRLYSSMAASLIHFYRYFPHDLWHHKNDIIKTSGSLATTFGGGDFAKLVYWGLIREAQKEDGEDKRTSGTWMITETGIEFVRRQRRVKSHIRLYDSRKLSFSGEDVYIDDCLGKKFSYLELMS